MYHVWVGAARFELALVGPKTTVLTKLDDTPKVALLTRAEKRPDRRSDMLPPIGLVRGGARYA